MAFYWKTKICKTQHELDQFISKNRNKYQFQQIFINNKFATEYKDLIKVKL